MRALIVARQKVPAPPEALPMLAQGFQAWRDQYRDKMEVFAFFTGANGGCAIVNVADETELYQITLDWPLNAFSNLDVEPLVDGDEALSRWSARVQQLADQLR